MDKKGAKGFQKMLNDLGGASKGQEPAETKKQDAKPAIIPTKGRRDPRLPPPVKRRSTEDLLG